MNNRVMPQSPEIEQEILGAIMLDPDKLSIARRYVIPESFYLDQHRQIFKSMCELARRNLLPDLASVIDDLRTRNLLEKCGGAGYLASLLGSVSTSAHVEYHCGLIKDKYLTRELICACNDITDRAYKADDPQELFKLAESKIFAIVRSAGRVTDLKSLQDAYEEVYQDVIHASDWRDKHPGERYLPGLSTGYKGIDEYLDGMREGGLYVIAADTNVGKTALTLNIVSNLCEVKAKQIIFSLEMPAKQLATRFIAMRTGIPQYKIEHAEMCQAEWDKFQACTCENFPVFIGDATGLTPDRIAGTVKANIEDLKLVVVDYIQLVKISKHNETRERDISEIVESMKQLALETCVPILILSQIGREGAKREHGEFNLHDLRESGAIENNADGVICMWREKESVNAKKTVDNIVEIRGKVDKNRHGKRGYFTLKFDHDRLRFFEENKL